MIGFLSGLLHSKLTDSIILLVGGVGYRVIVTQNTLNVLLVQQQLELYIYTHVKQDAIDLYGFKSQPELDFFKLVLGVSGIGPKTALLVIDRGVASIKEAIIKADTDFFSTIPRLGQKNAQRIIIDLKTKLGGITDLDLNRESTQIMDVVEALQSMGYSRQEALIVVKSVPEGETSLEQKITFVLKQIGKTKLR